MVRGVVRCGEVVVRCGEAGVNCGEDGVSCGEFGASCCEVGVSCGEFGVNSQWICIVQWLETTIFTFNAKSANRTHPE